MTNILHIALKSKKECFAYFLNLKKTMQVLVKVGYLEINNSIVLILK